MSRSRRPPVLVAAALAWLIGAAYLLVVRGILDSEHMFAPYLGIVVYLPFWLMALWAGVLLVRGAGRTGQATWSLAASVLAGSASFVFVTSVGSTPEINPEGYGAMLLAVLSIAAFVDAIRRRRTPEPA